MFTSTESDLRGTQFRQPVRNHYFHGKRLNVFDFELEQDYFNEKRWLINRSVIGSGVVCGLDVVPNEDRGGVLVQPGLALDHAGREVIVSCPSGAIVVPTRPKPAPTPTPADTKAAAATTDPRACPDDEWMNLVICYHECPSDPMPAPGDECGAEKCVPSVVRERYRLSLRPGRACLPAEDCWLQQVRQGNQLERDEIVRWISRQCCPIPADTCIPLANIRRPYDGETLNKERDINIGVRPIVYTNQLLALLMGRR